MKKRAMGVEPTTSSLGSWHSTTELRPQNATINDRLSRFDEYTEENSTRPVAPWVTPFDNALWRCRK